MPGDTRPHVARAAKKAKRRPTPGTIKHLQEKLWSIIAQAEERLNTENLSNNEFKSLAHTVIQAAGPYIKAVEVGEHEARLQALEEQVKKS
jgi:hypothetical protein